MPILKLCNVTKAFGGVIAVNDASFAVAAGSIHGLIGPNGAGKTTLFSLITGFYKPSQGQILLDGVDITALSTSARARMGLVRTFQGTVLFPEQSVTENIENGMLALRRTSWLSEIFRPQMGRRVAKTRVEEILDFVRLGDLRGSVAGDLSHGQQRVLGIAIALAANPRLLLLDEPFTGMTAGEKDRLVEMLLRLKAQGMTIVLVEHDMRTVMQLCDTITVLNFGKVLTEGSPEQVRRHPEVMAAYLGTSA
jgi:branched-chain amino acid transport system ATP-binding protein